MSEKTNHYYEFGPFRFCPEEQALVRDGKPVSLPPRVTETLSLLLRNAGHLVEKERLIKEVWKDAIVEEGNLNKNIFILRKTLGQTEGGREYIETVPKRGYRFVGAVQKQTSDTISPSAPKTVIPKSNGAPRFTKARIVVLLGLLTSSGVWLTFQKSNISTLPPLDIVPLVAMEGSQVAPVLSPDGNQVAFKQLDDAKSGIYVTLVDGEKPLQVTDGGGDCCPAWSPDGRRIVFLRWSKESWSIYEVAALGGTARKLYSGNIGPRLDWSPDGRFLLFSEIKKGEVVARIVLFSVMDSTAKQLTSPPHTEQDDAPAFSPDGSQVAFVRGGVGGMGRNVFVVPVSGGEPKQLTFNNSSQYPAWTGDGKEIVFHSQKGASPYSLWRIPASGGTQRPLAGIGPIAFNTSISRRGNQLAYQHAVYKTSIDRIYLTDESRSLAPTVTVISSSGANFRPNYSPDGRKIVFESDRLGYSNIWYCDSDGSHCNQLTSLRGTSGTGRWSPDGHQVVFEAQTDGYYDIYVIDVPSGRPQRVQTFPGCDNGAPNWSRDGRSIYFYSTHQNGSFQLWKTQLQDGSPVQITKNGGVYAMESYDGHFLYYSKLNQAGIWKMSLDGGDETRILERPDNWYNWTLGTTGIYFLDESSGPNGTIQFFNFGTHRTTSVHHLEKPVFGPGGLSLSPDGHSLVYSHLDFLQSDIMLVKNFR